MKRHRLPAGTAPTIGIAVLLLATGAGAAGRADPRVLEARRACAAGNVERGVELLAEIVAEQNDPNAVYNQARCYQANGRPEEAIARFREYLRLSPKLSAKGRAEVAAHVHELEQWLDARARRAALAAPPAGLAPSPAAAAASAPAPAAPTTAPVALSAAAVPEPQGPRTLLVAGAVTAAVGVAALAGGVFYSLETRRIERQIERQSLPVASEMHQRRIREGERAQRRQWIGYGIGAAALAATAGLYLFQARF